MSTRLSEQNTAERITFIASLTILAVIVGLAIWADIRTGDASPTIEIEVHEASIRETENGFYVPISVTNTGGKTAQDVVVTGELKRSNGTTETAEVTFAFLAGAEEEQAELVFSSNPADGELTVRPTSFIVP
ncbi:MAG: hypothetical protein KC435_07430 [Thermomicrobiales bacterium]|nr:hypothetical protein [Thermomicrobiales bacterium]